MWRVTGLPISVYFVGFFVNTNIAFGNILVKSFQDKETGARDAGAEKK
jgi:hypothetical protein